MTGLQLFVLGFIAGATSVGLFWYLWHKSDGKLPSEPRPSDGVLD